MCLQLVQRLVKGIHDVIEYWHDGTLSYRNIREPQSADSEPLQNLTSLCFLHLKVLGIVVGKPVETTKALEMLQIPFDFSLIGRSNNYETGADCVMRPILCVCTQALLCVLLQERTRHF